VGRKPNQPRSRRAPYLTNQCLLSEFILVLQKHVGLLEALYRLYERIVGYHTALTAFFGRLREGAYIQASVESMLLVGQNFLFRSLQGSAESLVRLHEGAHILGVGGEHAAAGSEAYVFDL